MSLVIYVLLFAVALSMGPATKTGDQSHMSIPGLEVTHLPDGIAIKGPEDLRQIVATWDVFVTLKHPPLDKSLIKKVKDLDTIFQNINALQTRGVPSLDLNPQHLRRDRLVAIIDMMPGNVVLSRGKRGLADFGGDILHFLFGVATSAQLKRFEDALAETAKSQLVMSHAQSQLATVLNQTRTYVNHLAMEQHQLDVHLIKVNSAVNQLARRLQQVEHRISAIELLADLDRYIDIMDMACDSYKAQVDLYRSQKAELQVGHLTRHLLSEEQLGEILDQAKTKHEVSGPVEWHYQYLKVKPLRLNNDELIYRIIIPLVAPRPYLLYSLTLRFVPLNDSVMGIKIKLNDHYAIDS